MKSKSPQPPAQDAGGGHPAGASLFLLPSFISLAGFLDRAVITPRLVLPVRVEVVRHTIAPSEYGNPPGQNQLRRRFNNRAFTSGHSLSRMLKYTVSLTRPVCVIR
jgi:hypothetical protein